VNHEEIKQILLLYRPGTADVDDPEVAHALALAKSDPELSRWLVEHSARQSALREKFRQLPVLAGLKEQIISEEVAKTKAASRRDKIISLAAAMAIIISLLAVAFFFLPHKQNHSVPTLASLQAQMTYIAVSSYAMNLETNDPAKIQAYLAGNQAPSDYVLPAGLQKAALAGCAVESWQNSKVSMICFRTGKPLPPSQKSDLWLFVVDRANVKDASDIQSPQYAAMDGLTTATWTQNDKLYFLAAQGDEDTIKKFL
jgi:hypothetical protein